MSNIDSSTEKMYKKEEESSYFSKLLDFQGLLIEIASFLGDYENLRNLSLVCTLFGVASMNPYFWENLDVTFDNLHGKTRIPQFISRILIEWCNRSDSKKNQLDSFFTKLIEKHIKNWLYMDRF